MTPARDSNLIRYVDTTAVELVSVCGKCRRAAVVDVAQIISTRDANVWLGELRTSLQCPHCEARAPKLFTQSRALVF